MTYERAHRLHGKHAWGAEKAKDAEPARESVPGKRTLVESVQRQALNGHDGEEDAHDVHEAAQEGISGTGGALPYFEQIQRAFGEHDISDVRAHTDSSAAKGAKKMGAEAYATGNKIVFGSTPTLHTAAHEAAHVVQQRSGIKLNRGVGTAGDSFEKHADAVADRVVQGRSAAESAERDAWESSQKRSAQRNPKAYKAALASEIGASQKAERARINTPANADLATGQKNTGTAWAKDEMAVMTRWRDRLSNPKIVFGSATKVGAQWKTDLAAENVSLMQLLEHGFARNDTARAPGAGRVEVFNSAVVKTLARFGFSPGSTYGDTMHFDFIEGSTLATPGGRSPQNMKSDRFGPQGMRGPNQ